MFVSCLSLSWRCFRTILSSLGSRRVNLPPRGCFSVRCCCSVTALMSTVFVLRMLWWSLSLIFFSREVALCLVSIHRAQQRTFQNRSKTNDPLGSCCLLSGCVEKGILHLFISVALLYLSHARNDSEEERRLQPLVMLDWSGLNCGRVV